MKHHRTPVLLALLICGCSVTAVHPVSSAADPRLDEYLKRYSGYIGGLGIGFVASHTYEYQFRQRLAATQDLELKRLYVLYHLYNEVDGDLSALEEGQRVINEGKDIVGKREMTPNERTALRSEISKKINDLSRFDPGDPEGEIAEFAERLQKVKN